MMQSGSSSTCRNIEGVSEVSVHALSAVPLAFRGVLPRRGSRRNETPVEAVEVPAEVVEVPVEAVEAMGRRRRAGCRPPRRPAALDVPVVPRAVDAGAG